MLQRLQSGTYGDIYNFPVKEYEKVLAMEEMEAAGEEDEEEEEVMSLCSTCMSVSVILRSMMWEQIYIVHDNACEATTK